MKDVGEKEAILIENIDLSIREYNTLKRNGITYLNQLEEYTFEDFMKLRHMTRRLAGEIFEKILKYGISFQGLEVSNDEDKINTISMVDDESLKASIIIALSSDELKLQEIDKLTRESNKVKVIKSLTSDEIKIKEIENITDESNKRDIIMTLSTDEMKLQSLKKLTDELNKIMVIRTILSDDLKLKGLEEIIDESNKLRIIVSLSEEKNKLKELARLFNINYDIKKFEKKINLPENMTIGIEIEVDGDMAEILKECEILNWEGVEEFTVESGVEFVSPILSPNEESVDEIYQICNILEALGNKATEECGGHIHIGADYLKSKQSYINLLSIYGNTEELLYIICNDPNDINNRSTDFSETISGKIEEAIDDGTIDLQSDESIETFINQLVNIQKERDYGLNFLSYDKHKTLEFRMPNGTLNPDAWIDNINLFGGIIRCAEEIRVIQEKKEDDRTQEDNNKLNIFEKLQTEKLDNREKLELLLSLIIKEEDRDIYKNRYEQNIMLLSDKQKEQYKKGTAISPIKAKLIGKRAFTGAEKVSPTELKEAEYFWNRDIENCRNEEMK